MSENKKSERENKKDRANGEGDKRENRENEEASGIPDEWASVPFQDYFDKGFRPYKHRVRGKDYIVLRKGGEFKSLGPYDEDRWSLLVDMYPRKLPQPSSDNPPISERIAELKKEKLSKREIAQTLYNEGYPTSEMMRNGYPPVLLSSRRSKENLSDESVQAALRGATRGPGYLNELKSMIQKQISLSREFAESCTTAGVKVLFAALKIGGVNEEDISNITKDVGTLENVVNKATQAALKAIEYYDMEHIKRLEDERNEARAAYSLVAAQLRELQRNLEPRKTLERLIHSYIVSGNTDGNVLTALIDKLLSMEMHELQSEVLA